MTQKVLFITGISEDRPSDIPTDWTIYNAARPMPGHKTWRGKFRHGVFFSAVAPEGDPVDKFNDSARFHQQCQSLDGWECVWRTREDVLEYGRKLAEEHNLDFDDFDFDDILHSYSLQWKREIKAQ